MDCTLFPLYHSCVYRSNGDNQPIVANALYDFNAERNDEMSFSAGDELVCVCVCACVVCLHVSVCVCVCLHVYVCGVCMSLHVYVCGVCIIVRVPIVMHICIFLSACVRILSSVGTCMWAFLSTCMYMYMYLWYMYLSYRCLLQASYKVDGS